MKSQEDNLQPNTQKDIVKQDITDLNKIGVVENGVPPHFHRQYKLDHGNLEGLNDDDHSQYNRKDTLTTKGDIYIRNSSDIIRLAIGANNKVLTADSSQSTGAKWADVSDSNTASYEAEEAIDSGDVVSVHSSYTGGTMGSYTAVTNCSYTREDAYTSINNGASDYQIGGTPGYKKYLFIGPSSLPTLAGDSIKIKLRNYGSNGNYTYNVYILEAAFSEVSLSWSNQPSHGRKIGTFAIINSPDGDWNETTITGLSIADVYKINNYGIMIGENSTQIATIYKDESAGSEPAIAMTTGGTAGNRVVKADASANDYKANAFIGFATEAIAAGSSGKIQIGGIVTTKETLMETGVTYYLSDTAGDIQASTGTVSRKVGRAVSLTKLLIIHDNN